MVPNVQSLLAGNIVLPQKLFGIIGYPLGHSLSPVLHNWGFRKKFPDAVYMRWPVTSDQLPHFMEAVRVLPIHGVSVTIPHKESMFSYCDTVTEAARTVGAINTLYWREGLLWGDNTDVTGFIAPLQERGWTFSSALVLGAGGAARAVLAGLVAYGVRDIRIANRTLHTAKELAQQFGATAIPWEERESYIGQLVVNTTPCGMAGSSLAGTSPLSLEALQQAAASCHDAQGNSLERGTTHLLVYDIVYNPLETPLLRNALQAGWHVQDGLAMFIAQAVEQYRCWTGEMFSSQEARTLLVDTLTAY